jgi:aspartyl-tRNA(Asn)/glutamyl-tRNA(Gln) amidotransferase subunit C
MLIIGENMLQKQDMEKLAKLARLELTEQEADSFGQSLEQLLGYMENIKKLDLQNVEPMTGIQQEKVTMRPDEVVPGLDSENTFKNAPSVEANHFAIPKVMGEN